MWSDIESNDDYLNFGEVAEIAQIHQKFVLYQL